MYDCTLMENKKLIWDLRSDKKHTRKKNEFISIETKLFLPNLINNAFSHPMGVVRLKIDLKNRRFIYF